MTNAFEVIASLMRVANGAGPPSAVADAKAKLAKLDGCGHVPEIECPEMLLGAIAPFFAAIDAGDRD